MGEIEFTDKELLYAEEHWGDSVRNRVPRWSLGHYVKGAYVHSNAKCSLIEFYEKYKNILEVVQNDELVEKGYVVCPGD